MRAVIVLALALAGCSQYLTVQERDAIDQACAKRGGVESYDNNGGSRNFPILVRCTDGTRLRLARP